MEKEDIKGVLMSLEFEIAMLPYCSMSELVDFYEMLADKYSFRVSDYFIVKNEIFKEVQVNGGSTTTSFLSKNKVTGIDYEFLDFRFNEELKIDEIEHDNINYVGRSDFNRNSYFTTKVLIEKIQLLIKRDDTKDKILEFFNYIKDNCFPNMGGYAAIETCFILGSTYTEKGDIQFAMYFFNLMNEIRQDIADSTIGGFYKSACELLISFNLNNEALQMINKGLELYPKLSVKKIKKYLENK